MENSIQCVPATGTASNDDDVPLPRKLPAGPVGKQAAGASISPILRAMAQSAEWKDWKWQLRNRIRTMLRLTECFPKLKVSRNSLKAAEKFPQVSTES